MCGFLIEIIDVLVFLQWWSSFASSWLQMLYNQGLFFRYCTAHCKKEQVMEGTSRGWEGRGLAYGNLSKDSRSQNQTPSTDSLVLVFQNLRFPELPSRALILQSIEWVDVMESGSQCPACFNIVDFPGKLEGKKKKKEKGSLNTILCQKGKYTRRI